MTCLFLFFLFGDYDGLGIELQGLGRLRSKEVSGKMKITQCYFMDLIDTGLIQGMFTEQGQW